MHEEMLEMLEAIREIYQLMADENLLWKSLAVILRKVTHALIEEGFTREEALGIATQMASTIQPKHELAWRQRRAA